MPCDLGRFQVSTIEYNVDCAFSWLTFTMFVSLASILNLLRIVVMESCWLVHVLETWYQLERRDPVAALGRVGPVPCLGSTVELTP